MVQWDKDSIIEDLRTHLGLTLKDCRRVFAKYRTPKERKYIRAAEQQYEEDGAVEIDLDTEVSFCTVPPLGAYVQAWVWVPKL